MFELRGQFGKRVIGVVGGRTTVKNVDEVLKAIREIDRKCGTTTQVFDSTRIAGIEHLMHAARLALTAHATGTNFADSLEVELVCWAAGARQIDRAFERVGLRRWSKSVAFLTIGKTRNQVKRARADLLHRLRITRDDRTIELTPKKINTLLKVFAIPQQELKIADIKKLVLERVALLSLEK
jgi:KEOPS complex subunit Cgi121